MLTPMPEQDFDQFYTILTDSFPPDELRSRDEHEALLARPDYTVYAHYDRGELIAFLTVWETESLAFIEHFAVGKCHRNRGLGAKLLEQLKKQLGKPLCLEAELPNSPLAERRLAFYERNGFLINQFPYMQPALEPGKQPVPLYLLTTDKPLDVESFLTIKQYLYTVVYAGKEILTSER